MMSVLVPSFPSSTNSHHHCFPNRRINGNLSQSIKHMSLTFEKPRDINNDHVPFGVVNSMKQRLLDKVNESLLLNTRHSLLKSSNENLLQTKPILSPLKHTTRLSRSQDNLSNNTIEQLTSYLQPKQDLIIIDTTTLNDDNISTHRHSYTELHVDEVPKPGTVTTVKQMFERQIRLSRYDCDKLSNALIPSNSRVNTQNRDIRSPNRSRSISPNDMALRQRRTAAIPTPTTLSLPISTSYPDLVISHTPPTSSYIETNKITNEESVINTQKDENTNINTNQSRPNLVLPSISSSDTADYQPLDFKSRLALFNRTNTIERSNEHSHIPANIKKPSNHHHSVPPSPNLLTKPIVHHHQSEKKDISPDQIPRTVVNTAKSITFFGGTKTNENIKSIPPPSPSITIDETSIDIVRIPDIIGGNVKLNKSSIFSGMKKDARVQFIDNVNTFEYPSFNIAVVEHGSTDSDDSDDDDKNPVDDVDDDELERLARINAKFNSNNLTEKSLEPKGSLHTFRPTHIDQYELGTQHGSNSSDIFSREKYFSLSDNFSNHSILKQEMTNNIQWSSMSTTTDLLF